MGSILREPFLAIPLCRLLSAARRRPQDSRRGLRGRLRIPPSGALGSVVVAIDRDRKALDIARRDFQLENVRFVEDDCETLEAARPHGPFHALVSFETLEHLRHPEVFLATAAEMLSSNGVALVSVPNGDVFTSQDWEFHERDYNASDLEELLSQVGFRHLELFGQYLTPLGRLREQVRAEIHRIRFNPFFPLGAWLQERLRHHRLPPALPEQAEDFEIRPTNAAEIRGQGKDGPFVILAAATSIAPR